MSAMPSLVQAPTTSTSSQDGGVTCISASSSNSSTPACSWLRKSPKQRIKHQRKWHLAGKECRSGDQAAQAASAPGISERALNTTKHLLAGAAAAVVSRTAVAPLERVKLEYAVRGAQGSVGATLGRILQGEGWRGLWKGNAINLVRTAPFKALNFFAFDHYRRLLTQRRGSPEMSHWERLAAGAAAGVTATVLCFPLDTLRTRMVAQGRVALPQLLRCLHEVLRTEGGLALYRGLLPAVLSMAPGGAAFYGTYDLLRAAHLRSPAGQAHGNRQSSAPWEGPQQLELGPGRTLMYGAVAGAVAETVTYPFEVVRRQLQLQRAAQRVGLLATVHGLVQRGGPSALYAGLLPSVLQVLPSAALSYFVYELLKSGLQV